MGADRARRQRFGEWAAQPVSPRANLILACTGTAFGAAFLAGIVTWLLIAGQLSVAVEVAVMVCVGIVAGVLLTGRRRTGPGT